MAGSEEQGARQYVIFRIGGEQYGLPIEQVSSIIRYEPATPVPQAPSAVEGVINLRGRVIPVVDLKRSLLDAQFEPTALSRIVVAEGEGGQVGLAVDAASEVTTIDTAEIMPPPETALTATTMEAFDGVVKHGDGLIILLNLDKALPQADYERAAAVEVETDV